jgi:murein endopeptidase
MAKGQFHTAHQKGIIQRYYENKSDINTQKLSEIVSDLYLEESAAKQKRLWASAETALLNLGAKKEQVEQVVAERNLAALAKLAEKLF